MSWCLCCLKETIPTTNVKLGLFLHPASNFCCFVIGPEFLDIFLFSFPFCWLTNICPPCPHMFQLLHEWYYLWHRMHILPREPGTALWEGGKGLPGNCHSRVRHPGWAPLFAGLHFFLFLIFLPFRWRTSRYFLSKGAKEVDFLGSCLSEKVFILTLLLTV